MIERLPLYVSLTFILTALLTVWLLLKSIPRSENGSFPAKLLLFVLPFWFVLQGILGVSDFYHFTTTVPPRVFVFGVLPVLLLIIAYFALFRGFVNSLSLKALTLVHIIRIPVELVLLWLFQAGQVPQLMTFEGRNFDILSGLTAPLIYFVAFRKGKPNRAMLVIWNLIALGLLANVVAIAFLSFPSPVQHLALDQPNVAVTYFPFIWLPAIVVPTVLFCHLAALWKLFTGRYD